MAAGWPAGLAVVLLACAAPLLLLSPPVDCGGGGGAVGPNDDVSWCAREGCRCVPTDDQQQQQVSLKCAFSGDKNVSWKQNNDVSSSRLAKSLVSVELNGDGLCRLTVHGKPFAAFERLRSIDVSGFAEVTIGNHGLQVKNSADTNLTVTISRAAEVTLSTNAIKPVLCWVDVKLADCGRAKLSSGVVSRLRSFVFSRIDSLELTNNTFKNAAEKLSIDRVLLENLTADKLPSYAFQTTISQLAITNCTIGTIEGNAFPVTEMETVTFTNVTVDRVESNAFHEKLMVTDLRMIECHVRVMENDAITSTVRNIHIERSRFESIRSSAVSVTYKLTLSNNTFELIESRGFVLNSCSLSVQMDGNTFVRLHPEAFYESTTVARQSESVLLVRENAFRQPANAPWSPAIRLQSPANESVVTGNRFTGRCGCGPWRFVADGDGDGVSDAGFPSENYCWLDETAARCANLTAAKADRDIRIGEFVEAAECGRNATDYDLCVSDGATAAKPDVPGRWIPGWERGIITTVVLLVLCGFGVVCAVRTVTWLNARGYFIKLRTLLTSCNRSGRDGGGGGGGRGDDRMTRSAHSLRPMPVHEYDEIQPRVGKRIVIYQDQGTQTVPEELTHEMLQFLREKLDDPDDYPHARGMIEHLYDLIRVEESCCVGGGGAGTGKSWYSSGLDDMVSTTTTKAVPANGARGERRNVVSVGTGAPSLDRLWPPKISVAYRHRMRPARTPSPPSTGDRGRGPPSVGDEYMDPADLLRGGGGGGSAPEDGDADDTDIYCDLDDLREDDADADADDDDERRHRNRRPPQPPPPVPRKPTEV